ncbi:hypothetical protein ACMDCT_08645 [Halomonadaceae bacterium KBTZ08]
MYQLVFSGEWEAGLDEQSAREKARNLFKANDAQLEKMFSGERVVIKNRLDEATAYKYQAAMKKNGLVAHIEPMQAVGQDSEAPRSRTPPDDGGQQGERSASPADGDASPAESVAVEPGDRLPVAGDKVDSILAGSGLSLGAPGERLEELRADPEPVFEHLDEWSVAPPGEDLAAREEKPEPPAPDISHLSLADEPKTGNG